MSRVDPGGWVERFRRWFHRIRRADLRVLVAALVAVALAIRVFDLGTRIAHWDEARVAFSVLRAVETGDWSYRPIIHGPFVQHLAAPLFATLGRTDFVMRLPVAVVGGLLPAVALCFRSRLDRREVIALAAVLAVDPLVLYYGRFFRSDVPLAAFALLAFGAGLRAIDTEDPRWWSVAGLAVGLALATKENALLYPVAWAGAGVVTLVLARFGLVRANVSSSDGLSPPGLDGANLPTLEPVRGRLRRAGPWIAGGVVVALAVVVVAYAPRTAGPTGGIEDLLADPASTGPVLAAATVGAAGDLGDLWLAPSTHDHSYALYLAHMVAVLLVASLGTIVAAAVGIATDRRPLVVFATVWGLASVVGYPYAADIKAPWLGVHAVVALAIPAAVGLVELHRRATRRVRERDRRPERPGIDRSRAIALAVLGLIGVQTVLVGGVLAYHHPEPRVNLVAQGAQPGDNFRPTMTVVGHVAAGHEGPDVAWAGGFAVENESATRVPPAPENWYDRLPLPWYTERVDATSISVADPADLGDRPPPVVIAPADEREDYASHLESYSATEFAILRHGEDHTYRFGPITHDVDGRSAVVWIDRSADGWCATE